MKIRSNFFLLVRVISLMAAPTIISGTPGIAATVSSTPVVAAASNSSFSLPDFVTVGDPNNSADRSGYGAVAAPFRISNRITVAQYAEMLNAVATTNDDHGLYDSMMGADLLNVLNRDLDDQGNYKYTPADGKGEAPMIVSLPSAFRYCNWLQNGQQQGNEDETTTEAGAYTLANQVNDNALVPNADASYFIPNENQWYKAAYYVGNGQYNYTSGNGSIGTLDNVYEWTSTDSSVSTEFYYVGRNGADHKERFFVMDPSVYSPSDAPITFRVAAPVVAIMATSYTKNLTPLQANQTFGTITHNPLANNIFDQQAIVAAIIAYLASLGLGASASTINTAAAITKYGAAALIAIAAIPIITEFIGHAIEGRARAHFAEEGGQKKGSVLDLISKEKTNEQIATASKKIIDANHDSAPMVYGYMSPTGEAFGRFATNWRNGWAPLFNMIGFNITSDELHISHKEMDDISQELANQKKQADQITGLISGLQSQAANQMHQISDRSDIKILSSMSGATSILDQPERPTIASLQAKQTNCIVRGIKYVGNGISSFLSNKVKALDEKWENFQIGIRNGGVTADGDGDSSLQRLSGGSYSYQAIGSSDPSGRGFGSTSDYSGRDPHVSNRQNGETSTEKMPWEVRK